jgi:hypothetical protein
VVAIVMLSQVLNLFCNPDRKLSRSCSSSLWIPVDDVLRASKETVLVPLRTIAYLPLFATNVAEPVAARTPGAIRLADSKSLLRVGKLT